MEDIMPRLFPVVVALSLIGAVVATPADAAQRAFVSSTGSDANTASGCGLATPCRTFASAQTVVNDGGEIVALDAAGYGPITITKSVTITANPGFYAGIAVASGNAVTIATAGIKVILRGLNINGTGGTPFGVVMTNGDRLSIENCVISNFSNGYGVLVNGAVAAVRIIDSILRDNAYGVLLQDGATAVISSSKILGNSNAGVYVVGTTAGTTTTAAISDTVVALGNGSGVSSDSTTATAIAQMSVTGSTLSNNPFGAVVSGADAVLTLSNSMVTGNAVGLMQSSGTGTFESLGNNTVRQNTTPTSGTITTVSPM
jgi:hypothetical protein